MSGPLQFVWSWPDADVTVLDPAMVIVCREPDGRWYVTFTVDTARPRSRCPRPAVRVGVDLGVTDFAVTSDGERIANPRHLARRAQNLARYQRRMARCQKGSATRPGPRRRSPAPTARSATPARDFLHRASTALVRRNDVIVIEDLERLRTWSRTGTWPAPSRTAGGASSAASSSTSASGTGETWSCIDRWYPSSKTCSACGHLLAELSLSIRHWRCPSCGTRHDRDINAAKNILAAGLAVSACGGDVRHSGSSRVRSPVKQEPRPARAGIPVPQGGE